MKKALGECGAIEATLEAMKRNANYSDVCINGCAVLADITFENGKFFHPYDLSGIKGFIQTLHRR